jgi:hypothetical protein
MTTLTFKLDDSEARVLRLAAKRAKLTLSEFLRQKLRAPNAMPPPVSLTTCPLTGATIFASAPHFPPLTTDLVKEIMQDFP